MATAAVGRDDGRATALTVVLPLKWWGPKVLAARFWILRRRRLRHRFRPVDDLQFISAIRWSLLPPLDGSGRRNLLFESNFDGDWDEYLDTFGVAIPKELATIIRPGIGYPGLTIPGMFKAYAKATDHVPDHYVAAAPSLTARDIRRELVAREGTGVVDRIAGEGFGRTAPNWTTFLLPVARGREGEAMRAARAFDAPPGSPFLATRRVHFARIVVLRRHPQSWLLVTLTHDGRVEPIVATMLRQPGGERLRALLDCVDGVPSPSAGWWDEDDLVRLLLRHRPRSSRHALSFCPHPWTTVIDLESFVDEPRRDAVWPDLVEGR